MKLSLPLTNPDPQERIENMPKRNGLRPLTLLLLSLLLTQQGQTLYPQETESEALVDSDETSRSTAVTLNYCRASFHRLRKNPSKRVLMEEQDKILNNLDLKGIEDPEVVTLYSDVLDEVGREEMAERERHVIQQGYVRGVRGDLVNKAFVMSTQITTFQYVEAVRTGCNGWWDYRARGQNRDLDLWKVEKTRMTEVMGKSSKFLDTFWKLAQKKNIPDRWLVRGDDLDRLELAQNEPNGETRLRILNRMEGYMECYPPYWYVLARTQQSLGQLAEARSTYQRLEAMGRGHFRKDEMLATALANRAAIEAYLHDPNAPQTAQRGLDYSRSTWQANLVAAKVLLDAGEEEAAEDAILHNLDINLEEIQSRASLVSLYCETGQRGKLADQLTPESVAHLPIPILLQAAATMGGKDLPKAAERQIVASLYAYEINQFGRNQLIFVTDPAWDISKARIALQKDDEELGEPEIVRGKQANELRFSLNRRLSSNDALTLALEFEETLPVTLHFRHLPWTRELQTHLARQEKPETILTGFRSPRRRSGYLITDVEFGNVRIGLMSKNAQDYTNPSSLESSR